MKIGILHTGDARPLVYPEHGDYAHMFDSLLHDGGYSGDLVHFHHIRDMDFPQSVNDADAWLITGSRNGVYEELEWIKPLESFIQEVQLSKIPTVGICFGHQIMAQALGGKVIKSPKGWGLGVHKYNVVSQKSWIASCPSQISFQVHHQDQVIEKPSDTEVILSSNFCEFAALSYGNWGISFQGHPEFTNEYAADLIRIRQRLQNGLTDQEAMTALKDINQKVDRSLNAKSINNFIQSSVNNISK